MYLRIIHLRIIHLRINSNAINVFENTPREECEECEKKEKQDVYLHPYLKSRTRMGIITFPLILNK
jgi:hypothetical protein